jgi:hypothetical protein
MVDQLKTKKAIFSPFQLHDLLGQHMQKRKTDADRGENESQTQPDIA